MAEKSKKTGIKKEFNVSEDLRKIIGTNKGEKITRPQVVKRLWEYVKDNNLQDPENKQWFTPDKTMAPIFGEEKIKAFGMLKYLKVSAMLRDPNSVVRGFFFIEPPVSDACQRTQVMSPLFLVVPSPNTVLMFHF